MNSLSNFIILSLCIYICGILWFIIGIILSKKTFNNSSYCPNVSVIICVKNGQGSLKNILDDLYFQDYSAKVEFIIVDDNSEDKTKDIIKNYVNKDNRFHYINSLIGDNTLKYKKKALDAGIKSSKYDILLFTDVDCRVGPNWVSSMISNFNNNIDYVIGYSRVQDGENFVSQFQQLDFMMLMYAALGSTSMGTPIASTGQNQAYKKDVFLSVNGFSSISHIMQGDDSIFLNICRNLSNAVTVFSKKKESYVDSKVHVSWKNFILQRARWAGDASIMWKYNKSFFIYIVFTFIINSILLFSPILYFIFPSLIISVILLKFIFELFLYICGIIQFSEKINIILFIKWFCIQPIYVFF